MSNHPPQKLNTEDIELQDLNSPQASQLGKASVQTFSTEESAGGGLSTRDGSLGSVSLGGGSAGGTDLSAANLTNALKNFNLQNSLSLMSNNLKSSGMVSNQVLTKVLGPKQILILRPWAGEFFAKPTSLSSVDALIFNIKNAPKIMKNLSYFRGNYLISSLTVTTVGLLLTPSALLTLAITVLAAAWFSVKNRDENWRTVVLGREITKPQRSIGMAGLCMAFVLFMIGGLVLFLIGVGAALSGVHAVVHTPVRDYNELDEAGEELGPNNNV